MNCKHVYTRRGKYRIVADLLVNEQGRLLDIGARDLSLQSALNNGRIAYYSADIDDAHDYQLDLEAPLDLPDGAFDYVVALDVLEHVENIHTAFQELARITAGTLIVGLPNMSTLRRRLRFLSHADLGTEKYDLLPHHQGDRHRWLTVYSQINTFIETNATASGLVLNSVVEQLEGSRVTRALGEIAARLGLCRNGLLTGRCIYEAIRPTQE